MRLLRIPDALTSCLVLGCPCCLAHRPLYLAFTPGKVDERFCVDRHVKLQQSSLTTLSFSSVNVDDGDHPRPWENPSHAPMAVELMNRITKKLPCIETERLVLRAPRIEDFDAYYDIATSDRWYDDDDEDGPTTREDIWLDFLQMIAGWIVRGYGLFTVDAKTATFATATSTSGSDPPLHDSSSPLVGFVLLNHEYGDKFTEIGWMLVEHAEGKGYATEAARALLDYTDEFLFQALSTNTASSRASPPIVSYIAPCNERSIRVAERLGGQRLPEMENGNLVFHYPRDIRTKKLSSDTT